MWLVDRHTSLLYLLIIADMISIAENPKCSYRDAEEFCSLLRQLLNDCGYSLTRDEDEEPPLLLRLAPQPADLYAQFYFTKVVLVEC